MARTPTQKQQKKINDKRIETAYGLHCSGISIRMLDIPKVSKVGQASIDSGADDAALGAAIRAFVETIRVN